MKQLKKIHIPDFGHNNISVFSGAGGLDVGLHEAGWDTVAFIEKDSDCIATIQENKYKYSKTRTPLIFEDVNDFTEDNLQTIQERTYSQEFGKINLVSGGTPCQPFSTAGKRKGLGDPRGLLFYKFANIIKMAMPRFFILENVRGFTSAALPNDRPGSVLKRVVYPTFQSMGYELAAGLLNARNYGIAQDRTRFILIGSLEHEFGCYPTIMPTEELVVPLTTEWLTLKDVISEEHLRYSGVGWNPEIKKEYIPYSAKRAEVYQQIPAGKNWRYFDDEEYVESIMGGAYKSTGGRVGFWRRLSWDKWAPTLTTSTVQKATGFCHPDEVRPLTVQEYQLLQGFSKFHTFCGSTASKYRQIGNAVPVGLGKAIGHTLLQIVDEQYLREEERKG